MSSGQDAPFTMTPQSMNLPDTTQEVDVPADLGGGPDTTHDIIIQDSDPFSKSNSNSQTDPNVQDPAAMQLDPNELVVSHNINESNGASANPQDSAVTESEADEAGFDEPSADNC